MVATEAQNKSRVGKKDVQFGAYFIWHVWGLLSGAIWKKGGCKA